MERNSDEVSDDEFREFVAAVVLILAGLAAQVAAGTLHVLEWEGRMIAELQQAHAMAGWYGRLRAGDLAAFDNDDLRFGALAALSELPFLTAFGQDILAGKYRKPDGSQSEAPIKRRSALYAALLFGTANLALDLVADERIWWRLSAGADHCKDCERIAAGSPYAPGTLTTVPRGTEPLALVDAVVTWKQRAGSDPSSREVSI